MWQTYGHTVRPSVKLVAIFVSIYLNLCLSVRLFIPSVQMPVWVCVRVCVRACVRARVCVCVCVCVCYRRKVSAFLIFSAVFLNFAENDTGLYLYQTYFLQDIQRWWPCLMSLAEGLTQSIKIFLQISLPFILFRFLTSKTS